MWMCKNPRTRSPPSDQAESPTSLLCGTHTSFRNDLGPYSTRIVIRGAAALKLQWEPAPPAVQDDEKASEGPSGVFCRFCLVAEDATRSPSSSSSLRSHPTSPLSTGFDCPDRRIISQIFAVPGV
jgi:hypothetical protein